MTLFVVCIAGLIQISVAVAAQQWQNSPNSKVGIGGGNDRIRATPLWIRHLIFVLLRFQYLSVLSTYPKINCWSKDNKKEKNKITHESL